MDAPVVATRKTVTLADKLDLRNLPLATTPAGKNFVIKTLHPADHDIKVARGPGGVFPSLGITADLMETFRPEEEMTDLLIVQIPNPVIPLVIFNKFQTGPSNFTPFGVWLNPVFSDNGEGGLVTVRDTVGVLDYLRRYEYMSSKFEQYRVLSQSFTLDFIAPALKSQGTVLSAQMTISPKTVSGFTLSPDSNQIGLGADIWVYNAPPEVESMLQATNAYTGHLRDGIYQPLKLGKYKFISVDDTFIPMQGGARQLSTAAITTMGRSYGEFPYGLGYNLWQPNSTAIVKPSSKVIGMTYISGFDASGRDIAFRIRARQTVEAIPVIGGTYATFAQAPYPPDDLAYKMAREIAARMDDAYPARFNDTNSLRAAVKRIGESVLQFAEPLLDALSIVPGAGSIVGAGRLVTSGVRAVAPLVQNLVDRTKNKQKRKKRRKKNAARAQAGAAQLGQAIATLVQKRHSNGKHPPLPPKPK